MNPQFPHRLLSGELNDWGQVDSRGQVGGTTRDKPWILMGGGEVGKGPADQEPWRPRALAVHLVPEPSATSQDRCSAAAPVSRDRHSREQ